MPRALEGLSKAALGDRTGLAIKGGYWNGAIATLRNNNLVTVDGASIRVRVGGRQ
jgi:hypothetical protein